MIYGTALQACDKVRAIRYGLQVDRHTLSDRACFTTSFFLSVVDSHPFSASLRL